MCAIKIIRRHIIARSRGRKPILEFIVNSATDARKRYKVALRARTWTCSCPGWTFRHIVCKHITAAKRAIA